MSDGSQSTGCGKVSDGKRDSLSPSPSSVLPHPLLLRSRQRTAEEVERGRTGSLPPVINGLKRNNSPPLLVGHLIHVRPMTGSAGSSTQSSSLALNRVKVSSSSLNRSSSSLSAPWQPRTRTASVGGKNDLTKKDGPRKNALVPDDLTSKSLHDLAVKFETLSARQTNYSLKSTSHLPAL